MSFLGGLGQSLSSLAASEHQTRQDETLRKEREKNLQLQGLQLLLGQNDLPMGVYADTISAVGQLTGHKPTQQAADLIRQQLHQTVQAESPSPTSIAGQHGLGTPPPMTYNGEGTPRNVYAAEKMLPSRIAERQAAIKLSQQVDPSDPEYTLWYDANGTLVNRTHSQVASVANKQAQIDADKAKQQEWFNQQKEIKSLGAQLKSQERMMQLRQAYPNATQDEIVQVLQKEEAQKKEKIDAQIALSRASANAIPQRLQIERERVTQGWQRLDVDAIDKEARRDLAANKEAYDQVVQPLLVQLRSTRDEIEYLDKFRAVGFTPAQTEEYNRQKQYEQSLLNEIWTAKGMYAPSKGVKSPPSRGGGSKSPNYVAPKVPKDKLQSLMQ